MEIEDLRQTVTKTEEDRYRRINVAMERFAAMRTKRVLENCFRSCKDFVEISRREKAAGEVESRYQAQIDKLSDEKRQLAETLRQRDLLIYKLKRDRDKQAMKKLHWLFDGCYSTVGPERAKVYFEAWKTDKNIRIDQQIWRAQQKAVDARAEAHRLLENAQLAL